MTFYDPLVESLEPKKGSFSWRRSPVPLPSLPGSLNPFRVSPGGSKASSNPFEKWVQESPLHNNEKSGETEGLLQAEGSFSNRAVCFFFWLSFPLGACFNCREFVKGY